GAEQPADERRHYPDREAVHQGHGHPRGDAQPRRGRHPRLRSVPQLLDARRGGNAACGAAARRGRQRPRGGPAMKARLLVIGYGNELRGDDGVGPAAARAVAAWAEPCVQAIATHQLTPELADAIAGAEEVVFVDARIGAGEVVLHRVTPSSTASAL